MTRSKLRLAAAALPAVINATTSAETSANVTVLLDVLPAAAAVSANASSCVLVATQAPAELNDAERARVTDTFGQERGWARHTYVCADVPAGAPVPIAFTATEQREFGRG